MTKPAFTSRRGGFTLAELIVATTLITIVMTAVYASFSATIRTWKQGEAHLQEFQDIRTALSTMEFELGRALSDADHLMQGTGDTLEFFALAPPMNVDKGEGARVLWVKYRYNPTGKTLVREEGVVEKPLPQPDVQGGAIDEARIVIEGKHEFALAGKVRGLKIAYCWVPPVDRNPTEAPQWVEPIVLQEHRRGWGRPQGMAIAVTFDDETAEGGVRTFTARIAFRGQSAVYDASRFSVAGGRPR